MHYPTQTQTHTHTLLLGAFTPMSFERRQEQGRVLMITGFCSLALLLQFYLGGSQDDFEMRTLMVPDTLVVPDTLEAAVEEWYAQLSEAEQHQTNVQFVSVGNLIALPETGATLIVDVGAHRWSDCLPMLRRLDNAWLIAIEPDVENYMELRERILQVYPDVADRVLLFSVAISDHEGFRAIPFTAYSNTECGRILGSSPEAPEGCGEQIGRKSLPSVSLQTLLGSLPLASMELLFLKIDAEGAGLQVLRSLGSLAANVTAIKVELEEGRNLEETMAYLSSRGFSLDAEQRLTPLLADLDYDDVRYRASSCNSSRSCGCKSNDAAQADCYFYRTSAMLETA
ncbi:unnamed protein product [Polarella glacialis]|uniref:Methyltransferase FkbM domain-containing protein n=1 Tax=Polarella glacialis TaxID=89957 RepID=A0A813GIB4_POLGL|nr:unnamed protein product [Polarella glacialis]